MKNKKTSSKKAATTRQRPAKKRSAPNRPLHKRVLLHPVSVMAVLCAAVFVTGWTYHAIADYYTVNGKVPAAPLTEPAVITTPSDGETLQSSPTDVSGTCPVNSYVKLTVNGSFSGSAWCSNNLFTITAGLVPGNNVLSAQDYNVTDNPGPASGNINVTYAPNNGGGGSSGQGSSGSSQSPGPSGSTTPAATRTPATSSGAGSLQLGSDFHYQTFVTGSAYSWVITITSGFKPYAVHIAWDDGTTSDMKVAEPGPLTISHTYSSPGVYDVLVTVTDKTGVTKIIQLTALVKRAGAVGFSSPCAGATPASSCQPPSQPSTPSLFSTLPKWLIFAWPSVVIVSLMLLSFWLGEREIAWRFNRQRHRWSH